MNQWHYNKIKQLKDWKSDLNAVLVFAKTDEETRKDTVRYISLLDYAIEQIERVQELEEELEKGETLLEKILPIYKRLKKQNKRYREALEFYANEETYETKFATDTDEIYDPFTLIELDEGRKARKALEGEE